MSQDNETMQLDVQQVLKNYAEELGSVMEPEQLKVQLQQLETQLDEASNCSLISAKAKILGAIFYAGIEIVTTEGDEWKFTGNAGCLATPGGGFLWGNIYTDNPTRLFNETRTLFFHALTAYTAVYFYAENGDLLGHYQSGGVSKVVGTGGGTGSWEKQ